MTAIARSDFRDAVETLLEAQRSATPGLLRKTQRHGPGSLTGEKPMAWQGEITDDLAYDAGTRARVMTQEVQLATTFPADLETDAFDDLMDALIERFTLNSAVIPSTITELVRIEPANVEVPKADGGSISYRGAIATIRLRIWEGRD